MHRILPLLLLVLVLFSGCGIMGSTADLLTPPKLTDDQVALDNALKAGVGTSYVQLRYPQRGAFLSAFIRFNLEVDQPDENCAVVFYGMENSVAAEDSELMMGVMMRGENDEWAFSKSIGTPDRDLQNVDFVRFIPVSDPSVNNIVVGWSSANSDRNKIAVYRFDRTDLSVVFETEYTECIDYDVDGDGLHELFLITAGSQVRMVRKEGQIASLENLEPMDGYRQVAYGRLTDSLGGIFIDYYTVTSTGRRLNTKVIAVDIERLDSDPLSELIPEEWGFYGTFERPEDAALCEDVNNDGMIDIPSLSLLPCYTEEDITGGMWLTEYVGIGEGGSFETVMRAVVNTQSGYLFEFPVQWVGVRSLTGTGLRVTVHADAFIDEWSFYVDRGNKEDSFSDVPLLRIRVVSEQDNIDDLEEQGYIYLDYKGLFKYYALIPKGSEATGLGITEDDVRTLFRKR